VSEYAEVKCNYTQFKAVASEDLNFSEIVIDAFLEAKWVDSGYQLSLYGLETQRSGKRKILAESLEHNWVLDAKVVRPLPSDISHQIKKILGNKNQEQLCYRQILELQRDCVGRIDFNIVENLDHTRQLALAPKCTSPSELLAKLYPYQDDGVSFMRYTLKRYGGLILADEMGLGKTIQLIALILSLNVSKGKKALVVCPTSLLTNWYRELEKFSPSLNVMIHRGAIRAGIAAAFNEIDVILVSYDTATTDISLLSDLEIEFLIADEAQAVKNPETNKRKALSSLDARFIIAVTGTPLENKLLDLWSLTDFVVRGFLGSIDNFLTLYDDNFEDAALLKAQIEPLFLRRLIKDVANDLPEKIDIDFPLELTDYMKEEYENVRKNAFEEYDRAGGLVASTRLQMYCADPRLLESSKNEPSHVYSTPKIEATVSIISKAFRSERKVLVFSQYNKVSNYIEDSFRKDKAIFWDCINGNTPDKERQIIVDNFTNFKGAACLVLNPKAAGSGLNITAATVVIHFTQVWNPALELQASARAFRRGQKCPVSIYRLYYESTIDEIMMNRSRWKRELSNDATPISSRLKSDLEKAYSISPLAE